MRFPRRPKNETQRIDFLLNDLAKTDCARGPGIRLEKVEEDGRTILRIVGNRAGFLRLGLDVARLSTPSPILPPEDKAHPDPVELRHTAKADFSYVEREGSLEVRFVLHQSTAEIEALAKQLEQQKRQGLRGAIFGYGFVVSMLVILLIGLWTAISWIVVAIGRLL